MDLDRGVLARIDRKLLSGFEHDVRYQMVRVPVTAAIWSMWRRYCAVLGLSMGRGIAGLIAHELGTVVKSDANSGAVFCAELERKAVARTGDLDARERRLNERERSLKASEQRLRARTTPLQSLVRVKVGRNEPCPCGSGLKYKRCHGV